MFVVTMNFTSKPETHEELKHAVQALQGSGQEGNQSSVLYISAENPELYLLIEGWNNYENFNAHYNRTVEPRQKSLADLCASSPRIEQFQISPFSPPETIDDLIPPFEIASYVGHLAGSGREEFKNIGKSVFEFLKKFAALQAHEKVLEVGCGIGRIAIPLTQYLTKGSYEGFDIIEHGIQWCQDKITPRYPNFHFFTADIYNQFYHPEGTQKASEYRFPYENESFDLVFLSSVFTHLLPTDMEHYVSEISRVLKPGGRVFGTFFIIDEEARKVLADKQSKMPFIHCEEGGYWACDPKQPEGAVGYEEEYLNELLAHNKLSPLHIVKMNWCVHAGAQDIIVAGKQTVE